MKTDVREEVRALAGKAILPVAACLVSWHLGVHLAPRARASDWPMWRFDAGRTASSPGGLARELLLQWVRKLPAPTPAWPESQTKLRFDASYEPVVAGGRVFVPSMRNDSITAYETKTGKLLWRFFTDGPVRFAPVAHRGNVLFASDDGHLYCVDARRGTLVWRFRGGPSDRKVIGNGRLVSAWPARGAPVVYDGTVYFAASIWPFMGTFIHALDAETGEVQWTQSGTGSIFIPQQHGARSFAGVAPQGYLAATDEKLLVSGGRTVPAAYDRRTGEHLYYHVSSRQFGKDAGGYEVAVGRDWFINGGAMYRLEDGKGVVRVRGGVVTADAIIAIDGDKLVAWALEPKVEVQTDSKGRKRERGSLPELWRAELPVPLDKVHIKAGSRLYASRRPVPDGTTGEVAAVDLPVADGRVEVSWGATVEGDVHGMVAGDGKLFVVTREGALYCFGALRRDPIAYGLDRPQAPRPDKHTRAAREIIDRTGVREGYCVALGIGDGRLVEELVRQSKLHVIAVDPDVNKVARLRGRLVEADLYGVRASVHLGDPLTFDLPPYVASLVVSADPDAARRFAAGPALARVFETLRPYGGMACFACSNEKVVLFKRAAEETGLPNAKVERRGGYAVVVRAGALPGSADWTHQYADAANSVVSRDTLVKAPLGLLWFGGPPNDEVLPRHGHGPTPQVAGGRLFIEGRNMLRAVDVYTGRLLWQRELKDVGEHYDNTSHHPGANEIGSNYVSLPDGVYVAWGEKCLGLDPATGRTFREYTLPARDGKQARWGLVVAFDDLLIAAATPVTVPPERDKEEKPPKPVKAPPGPEGLPADVTVLIEKNATWRYLAGSHPEGPWAGAAFDEAAWKSAAAGFGYGDGDDRTVLDMRRKYTTVYARKSFVVPDVSALGEVGLMVRYDDAFIAHLNGKEVVRVGVGSGSGRDAAKIKSHEAGKDYRYFEMGKAGAVLRKGPNVLAIEGHNSSASSSDFTLDPYLVATRSVPRPTVRTQPRPAPPEEAPKAEPMPSAVAALDEVDYSSASAAIVVMERKSGKVLWTRRAVYSFRHNAIVAGAPGREGAPSQKRGAKVFCIDGLSPDKTKRLGRRGVTPSGRPTLYALDARTGSVAWKTEENVFGTWLGYSEEHDVLLQAGSRGRDRARDEVGKGMVAYRGSDGTVLWRDLDTSYGSPCMIHHDTIITQGQALSLVTGEAKTRVHPLTDEETTWRFTRTYGCNTVIASEHLLTFRSGAAGYYDLERDSGTGNLGGFKSGCTSSLVVANGVLNAPDYTRTCACSYQNQTSLAMVHMPDVETWTFNRLEWTGKPVRRLGVNLGAPGDRLARNGTLWLEFPVTGGESPKVPAELEPKEGVTWFRKHSSLVDAGEGEGSGLAWVAASGAEGVEKLTLDLGTTEAGKDAEGPEREYTVRLVFMEPEKLAAGQRVFDVTIQGARVLEGFDPSGVTGGGGRALVREFEGVKVTRELVIDLAPRRAAGRKAVLCGVEVVAGEWP